MVERGKESYNLRAAAYLLNMGMGYGPQAMMSHHATYGNSSIIVTRIHVGNVSHTGGAIRMYYTKRNM
ncbi:unnamed protein product [Sphagnum troendelagicum]|uniref:Uncharacterized protein n=1 Tax=Sphagnum troendelagicum TaxID=128251 RepID=A0ABP0TW24_9BRYO